MEVYPLDNPLLMGDPTYVTPLMSRLTIDLLVAFQAATKVKW